MEELLGIPIYQVYGSTEAGHVTYNRLNKRAGPHVDRDSP